MMGTAIGWWGWRCLESNKEDAYIPSRRGRESFRKDYISFKTLRYQTSFRLLFNIPRDSTCVEFMTPCYFGAWLAPSPLPPSDLPYIHTVKVTLRPYGVAYIAAPIPILVSRSPARSIPPTHADRKTHAQRACPRTHGVFLPHEAKSRGRFPHEVSAANPHSLQRVMCRPKRPPFATVFAPTPWQGSSISRSSHSVTHPPPPSLWQTLA